jgi:hypothetical protein
MSVLGGKAVMQRTAPQRPILTHYQTFALVMVAKCP